MSLTVDGRAARARRPADARLAKARAYVAELERSVEQMRALKARKEAKRESTVSVEHTINLLEGRLAGARIQLEYLEGQP